MISAVIIHNSDLIQKEKRMNLKMDQQEISNMNNEKNGKEKVE